MGVYRFADIERTVLEQHEGIRARIHGLTRSAERADLPWASRAPRLLLLRLAAHFEEHLAFEERELVPRIREIDAWGEAREAAMLAEHREQRARLERVCALAEAPALTESTSLRGAIGELAESLLDDMLHEERTLAELAWIDEHGHVDQMTG